MATQDLSEDGYPIVWQSADEKLRVIARRDTIGFDEDFYKSLSSDDFAKLQKQVEEFGMWVIDLEEKFNNKKLKFKKEYFRVNTLKLIQNKIYQKK